MDASLYDNLRNTLARSGADAAIDQLRAELISAKDYQGLFYALLGAGHAVGPLLAGSLRLAMVTLGGVAVVRVFGLPPVALFAVIAGAVLFYAAAMLEAARRSSLFGG